MAHADFVHLRVHTAYSLSEGAIKIGDLVGLCREQRSPAVAMTDRGNLFGALEFSQACRKAGVQPILGCELPLSRNNGDRRFEERPLPPDWLVLLAQNETGWGNLMALSSAAYLESEAGEMPQVSVETLAAHSAGLLALTGGPAGPVGRLLFDRQGEAARKMLDRLITIFPERLYVELMRHGLDEEVAIEEQLIDLAYEFDLPLVATNDVYFGPREMFEAHDALLCIAQGAHVDDRDRRRLTPDHCFRTAAEMRELFSDLPEAIDNTLVIARRCAYMAPVRAPILPAYQVETGRSEAEELRHQAEEGLARRLERHVFTPDMTETERQAAAKPYLERLDYELGVIIDMKFPGYFLIVADFIRWAKEQGIPVGPGRGSGAGSVVAWALTITDLDPLRFGLLFERFLNPERVSMPDFDIDFCQERRDEVIDYVCRRYGEDRVAQIITFGKLQARAVIRDVGRVLGMPYGQVDRISKLIPYNPANPVTLQQAIRGEPQLQAMRDEDPTVKRLLDIALQLEGLYRHASTHAAGVVIGDRPLKELIPLYRDPRAPLPATQYSMKYVEMAGLVKFDFLGLKTLSVLDKTVDLVAQSGTEIDLQTLPLNDKPTFEMLGTGATVGVFQLESSGMRDVLRNLKPDSFEDIIALVALYRPGPMDNIPKYIACKHGLEKPDYLHDSLKDILRETYGVIIYQEQVMQIAQVLAGYSLGSADLLRRAMGKKIKSEMDAQSETFVGGAIANSVSKAQASHIFDLVAKFAGYGFNKSHAAAYALVAYQTGYLKTNHPVEFLAASMCFELNNTDKINGFRQELERLDIPLLPPDINRSGVDFMVERPENGGRAAIRYALAAIKTVGAQAMRAVVAEREANGPYESLLDFARRLDSRVLNKRQIENLARSGAFDGLNGNRRQVFEGAETLLRHAESAGRDAGQASLFGADTDTGATVLRLPDVLDWRPLDRLMNEQEAIGFYLSAHPLDGYGEVLARLGVTPFGEMAARVERGESRLRVAGVVLAVQERTGAGGRFAFIQLSDPTSSFEVAAFREAYAASRDLLIPGRSVLITAAVRNDGDVIKLTAQTVEDLEPKVAGRIQGLAIHLRDAAPLQPLKAILEREGEGRARISLVVATAGEDSVRIDLPSGYALSPALGAEIGALPGVERITEL